MFLVQGFQEDFETWYKGFWYKGFKKILGLDTRVFGTRVKILRLGTRVFWYKGFKKIIKLGTRVRVF